MNSVELLSVCEATPAGGLVFPCAAGEAELAGTGFEMHGATPWLRTRVPVTPGDTITISFAIWDSGDGVLDTTVLVDDFRWSASSLAAPVTQPAPEPGAAASGLAAVAALAAAERSGRPAERSAAAPAVIC